jgi:hypothetical protein
LRSAASAAGRFPPDFPPTGPARRRSVVAHMARRGSSNDEGATRSREVLEFECGVSAYAPASASGYWRLRWDRGGSAAGHDSEVLGGCDRQGGRAGRAVVVGDADGARLVPRQRADRPVSGSGPAAGSGAGVVGPASQGAGVVLPAIRDASDRRAAGAQTDAGAHAGHRRQGSDEVSGGAPVSVRLSDGRLRPGGRAAARASGRVARRALARPRPCRRSRWRGRLGTVGPDGGGGRHPHRHRRARPRQGGGCAAGGWWRELEVLLVAY